MKPPELILRPFILLSLAKWSAEETAAARSPTVKPGLCPFLLWPVGPCGELCNKDKDCPSAQKCCFNLCGHLCLPPYIPIEKPGVCPPCASAVKCKGFHMDLCASDENCPNAQKCCSSGCRRECKAPYKEKTGRCPPAALSFGPCLLQIRRPCASDLDCPGDNKCCSSICGQQCMALHIEKLGVCPPQPRGFRPCPEIALRPCGGDSSCPRDEKCCSSWCGQQCVAPYKEKPGECPRTLPCFGPCLELCANDLDCLNDHKCCSNGCGRHCTAPYVDKPGMCPPKALGGQLCPAGLPDRCASDRDCPNADRCCSHGCGRQCVAPYKEKPGMCPPRPLRPQFCPLMLADGCASDGDCPSDDKCCSNGCGQHCAGPYQPEPEKPGVCPSVPTHVVMCPFIAGGFCGIDHQCPDDEKCCSNGCAKICMPPYREKPGLCPVLDIMVGCTDTVDSCSHDGNCPNADKCCFTGCRKNCLAVPVPEKPGVCPSVPTHVVMCPFIAGGFCGIDHQCPDDEKCCSNGCAKICMPPYREKPGLCPVLDIMVGCTDTVDSCSHDGNCPNAEKCCLTGCRKNCLAVPVPEKPGKCPQVFHGLLRCVVKPADSCTHDLDCPDAEKCCSVGCSKQCSPPYEEKPGKCPKPKLAIGPCVHLCASDRDCSGSFKCCAHGCGLFCKAPEEEKPGLCPQIHFVVGCADTVDSCSHDGNCLNAEKCCFTGCAKRCMTVPIPEKPGLCPSEAPHVVMCPLMTVGVCSIDYDCPDEDKCCSQPCGKHCVAPYREKPGLCPVLDIMVGCTDTVDSCSHDGNCPNADKCCFTGCRKNCLTVPVPEKPGVCPSVPTHVVMCPFIAGGFCGIDHQCPDDEKCCSNGCAKICMPPYREKPGLCPVLDIMVGCTDTVDSCSHDGNCPNAEKCCLTGCRKNCLTVPVPEKPGVCPSVSPDVLVCPMMTEGFCAHDYDCTNDDKCCSTSTLCGRQCMAPYKEKPGKCPQPKLAIGPCVHLCASDGDCSGSLKCCSNGCGQLCTAPEKVTPGRCRKSKRSADAVC